MRILIWTDAFWPEVGGLEVFCMELASALKERGHSCEIIANRSGAGGYRKSFFKGIPLHSFPFWRQLQCGALENCRQQHEACSQIVRAFRPDVIHVNGMPRSTFHFVLQQKRERWPAVMTFHGHAEVLQEHSLSSSLLEQVDAVATVSDYVRMKTQGFVSGFGRHFETVLNALPDPKLNPAPFPLDPRILIFGRITEQKGFDLAIRAFLEVAPLYPKAKLSIAGEGEDRKKLEALARQSKFGARVNFLGLIRPEKIYRVINQHSLVVVPSRWEEPFGLVSLQAAWMGRPVIGSESGGIPEVVVHGETGLLFESDNVASLKSALQLLLGDQELSKRMGRAAYVRATTHFRFDEFISRYEELYRAV